MAFLRRRRRASPTDEEAPAEAGERAPDTEPAPSGAPEAKGVLGSTREALKPVKKRHILIASLGLMGVGLAGVLLFSAFSLWWTSQPSFCDRCHVMNTYVDTWEASPHGDINCEHCHINPGLFSFMGGKIAGLQVVANYITGHFDDDSFSAAVSNAACLECHGSLLDHEKNVIGDLNVSHLHIVDNGGKCMDCHSTVAHGNSVPVGAANFPTMDKCMKCHDGVLAPTTCSLCHRDGTPKNEPPPDQFGVTPDMRATVEQQS
jgi:nitrate/TMAO reductase-like tetraheme cytochrome c subunit